MSEVDSFQAHPIRDSTRRCQPRRPTSYSRDGGHQGARKVASRLVSETIREACPHPQGDRAHERQVSRLRLADRAHVGPDVVGPAAGAESACRLSPPQAHEEGPQLGGDTRRACGREAAKTAAKTLKSCFRHALRSSNGKGFFSELCSGSGFVAKLLQKFKVVAVALDLDISDFDVACSPIKRSSAIGSAPGTS